MQKINQTQLQEKDPDAENLLGRELGANPDAVYILAQTVLVQNIALDQAKAQIAQLQQQFEQARQQPAHTTSFLGRLLGDRDPQPPPPPPYQPVQQYAPPAQPQYQYGPPPQYPPQQQYAPAGYADYSQQQYPGYKFRRTSGVDGHHDAVRFGWELFGPDGTVLVAGIDIGVVDEGKLRSITGFFGELPEA